MKKYIYHPDIDDAPNYQDLGGKASNLDILSSNGIAVPSWFAVVGTAYRDFVRPAISDLIFDLDQESDIQRLRRNALAAQKIIQNIDLPKNFIDQIERCLALEPEESYYAVRSSATLEDSGQHSCAGLFDTFLYVPKSGVIECVIKCWASSFSMGALGYIRNVGLGSSTLDMAVVVQQMQHSVKSGVLFQANSEGILEESVVVAGFGQGEGVVSNQVESDTFYYNTLTGEKKVDTQLKKKKLVFNQQSGHGLVSKDVKGHLQSTPVLSDIELSQLMEISNHIYELYKEFQDIEWLIDTKGKIYITQSRPITSLPVGSLRLYDNSNIVEGYPGVTSPLTTSFVRRAYQANFYNAFRFFTYPKNILDLNKTVFAGMIVSIQGRLYYDLHNWYGLLTLIPGGARLIKPFETMIGASNNHELDIKKTKINIFSSVRLFFIIIKNFLRHEKFFIEYKTEFSSELKRARKQFANCDDVVSLWRLYNDSFDRISLLSPKLLLNDFYLMALMAVSKKTLIFFNVDEPETYLNHTLSGQTGLASVAPLLSVIELANYLNVHPELKSYLESEKLVSFDQIPEKYLDFKKMCLAHMDDFGERGINELKLESKLFKDAPDKLLNLALNQSESASCRTSLGVDTHSENQWQVKLDKALKKNILKKFIIRYQLKKLRRLIENRESGRIDRARKFSIFRDILTEIGKLWHEKNIIGNANDIFFLSLTDIESHIDYANSAELCTVIDNNKRKIDEYKNLNPVDRMWLKGDITENKIPQKMNNHSPEKLVDGHLFGSGCCSGNVQAVAKVMDFPREDESVQGKILVAESTDPGWAYLMMGAAGLIVEKGNILSHTSIIGRELGIPTIIGVEGAMQNILDGSIIQMDGSTGIINIIKENS